MQMVTEDVMVSHADQLAAAEDELAGIDGQVDLAVSAGDEDALSRLAARKQILAARVAKLRVLVAAEGEADYEAEMIRLSEVWQAAAAHTRAVTAKAQAMIREAQQAEHAAKIAYVDTRYHHDQAEEARRWLLEHPNGVIVGDDVKILEVVTPKRSHPEVERQERLAERRRAERIAAAEMGPQ